MDTSRSHFKKLVMWLLIATCLVVIPKYVSTNPGWFVAAITLVALAYSCAMVVVNSGRLISSLVFNDVTGIKHLRAPAGLALGAILLLYILISNGLVLYKAIESKTIECAYRNCNAIYTLKVNPDDYWSSVWFIAFMEVLLFMFFAFSIYALYKSVSCVRTGANTAVNRDAQKATLSGRPLP